MAYRVTYQVSVDWVAPGIGPMSGSTANNVPGSNAPAGGAQRLTFFDASGGQFTNTFTTADITTLTNGIASDMSTQFNAAIARVQAFATGGG